MIDTIVINIPRVKIKGLHMEKFKTFIKDSNYKGSNISIAKLISNPTKEDLLKGNYRPRLTLYNRRGSTTLRIEFSASKMLFKNNFIELKDDLFEELIDKLRQALFFQGIVIDREVLINHELSGIHYSKNIFLDKHLFPHMVLKELSNCDMSKRLDQTEIEYRNGGSLLKFRTNSYEYVFYDKIKDLEKSKTTEKGREEKDNAIQLHLFDFTNTAELPRVIRFETRLNTKKEIRSALRKAGLSESLTLKELFSMAKSKAVLLKTFENIESTRLPLLSESKKVEEFAGNFMINNPSASMNNMAMAYGYLMMLDGLNLKEFRNLTEVKYGKNSWSKAKSQLKRFSFDKSPQYSLINLIKSKLLAFERVTI